MTKEWLKNNDLSFKNHWKVCCIYKITNPSERIYIGQTVNLYRRILQYSKDFKKRKNDQRILYNSFLKYGIENHKVEIIEYIEDKSLLDEREIYYIDFFKSFNSKNKKGMNLTLGGKGAKGIKLSQEAINDIIKRSKNKVLTQETKDKIRLSMLGKSCKRPEGWISPLKGIPRSNETKEKISQKNIGRKRTEEQIEKMKFTRKNNGKPGNRKGAKLSEEQKALLKSYRVGTKWSEERRKKQCKTVDFNIENKKVFLGIGRGKTIYQYTLEGEYITCWKRADLKWNGFSDSAIISHIQRNSISTQGFKWSFNKLYEHEN